MRRGQSQAVLEERDRTEQERKLRKRNPQIELKDRLREATALIDEDLALRIRLAGEDFNCLLTLNTSYVTSKY